MAEAGHGRAAAQTFLCRRLPTLGLGDRHRRLYRRSAAADLVKCETDRAAANAPDVKKQFTDLGFDVVATTGAQFADFLKAEVERWKTVVETGKISVE